MDLDLVLVLLSVIRPSVEYGGEIWEGNKGKLCSSGEARRDGKDLPVRTCMCGSAHDCGCVVHGSMVAL